jgi:hypothetical protein
LRQLQKPPFVQSSSSRPSRRDAGRKPTSRVLQEVSSPSGRRPFSRSELAPHGPGTYRQSARIADNRRHSTRIRASGPAGAAS